MDPDDSRDSLIPSSAEATSTTSTDPWTDLLARYKAGDEEAFETLMADVTPELDRFRARRGISPAHADDVVGETLLTLWAKRGTFEGDHGGFRAWVRATLVLKARTLGRQRSRESARAASEEEFDALSVPETAHEGLECEAQWSFLYTVIPTLPASQRLVVLLRLADYEWDDTAWICSIEEGRRVTSNAASERYRLAVEKLRAEYARRG